MIESILRFLSKRISEDYRAFLSMGESAWGAIRNGNSVLAETAANEWIAMSKRFTKSWYFPIAIHEAHQIIGLVRLQEGDVIAACGQLELSISAPGVLPIERPLISFELARELVLQGNIEQVLTYLQLMRDNKSKEWQFLSRFQPGKYLWNWRESLINSWMSSIKNSEIPNHSQWIRTK